MGFNKVNTNVSGGKQPLQSLITVGGTTSFEGVMQLPVLKEKSTKTPN